MAQPKLHETTTTRTSEPRVYSLEIPEDEILMSQVEKEYPVLYAFLNRHTKSAITTSSDSNQPGVATQSLLAYHKSKGFQEAYEMATSDKNRRGRCLIINNRTFDKLPERLGTDVDKDKLKNFFEKLEYEVTVEENLTADGIVSECQMFIFGDFSGFDSCVLCILSHGSEGKIYGEDCRAVKENEILDLFDNPGCKLNGKPKLVIIQACRITMKKSFLQNLSDKLCFKGNVADTNDEAATQDVNQMIESLSKVVTEEENNTKKTYAATAQKDILVAYSSQPGTLSFRHCEEGSWFVFAIVNVLESQYKTEHVADMMKVARRVVRGASSELQVPHILDNLEKKFYFF